MAELVSDDVVERVIEGTEWRRDGDTLVRDSQLENFEAAIAFVNQVAEAAEEANHHPDILVHGWNKVRLTLTTHSAGGLTDNDIQMVAVLDAL